MYVFIITGLNVNGQSVWIDREQCSVQTRAEQPRCIFLARLKESTPNYRSLHQFIQVFVRYRMRPPSTSPVITAPEPIEAHRTLSNVLHVNTK